MGLAGVKYQLLYREWRQEQRLPVYCQRIAEETGDLLMTCKLQICGDTK